MRKEKVRDCKNLADYLQEIYRTAGAPIKDEVSCGVAEWLKEAFGVELTGRVKEKWLRSGTEKTYGDANVAHGPIRFCNFLVRRSCAA